ncbi:MAG: nucleotidyl transferase AbiEii/AbiGii toxin family protein [Myxococcota bacterium]
MNINQKLKILAKTQQLHVNQLRVLLGLERIVARLESHPILQKHLIFKGGFVLFKTISHPRFTRDIDASAMDLPDMDLVGYTYKALSTDLKDEFWYGDIKIKDLTTDQEYGGGYRFDCAFQIGNVPEPSQIHKLSRLHLDIGIGDRIPDTLQPQKMVSLMPTDTPISWMIYPPESILAEKLETLCKRGASNSRAKDIFDLIELFPICKDPERLAAAIQTTFQVRRTPRPKSFFEHVSSFEPLVLKSAWNSINLVGENRSFEQTWDGLLAQLKQFDDSRNLLPGVTKSRGEFDIEEGP